MAEITRQSSVDEIKPAEEVEEDEAQKPPPRWGGWGFSPLSYLSDLQKVAAVAAEEISRNAAEVAKSITTVPNEAEDSESSKDEDKGEPEVEEESQDRSDSRRKSALDKLEKASEDSFLGQGLKVLDNTVETFASGAWQALGNAWKGGSELVHRLEDSAVNIAESIQHGGPPARTGSVAPSLIETGKAFTAKGMQVLELVGKETLDLLSIEVDKETEEATGNFDEDQLYEQVTFDRCFYIYGGPEQLEELEALSNHYALLFNRKKAKLSPEQKAHYDGKLKEVQQIFDLSSEIDRSVVEAEKGKKVEAGNGSSIDEMKNLYDSSVSNAAKLAAGFANALAGLAPNDVVQKTAGRLDSLHSEGVHRLSEMCCFAVTHLFMLGKSIISATNKTGIQEIDEEIVKIDWPEDCVERAKIFRTKAQLMIGNVEAVADSFITGISDVAEAYIAAMQNATTDSHDNPQKSIQEKANAFSDNLRTDHGIAASKIQDGLQFLAYIVLSTSMPAV